MVSGAQVRGGVDTGIRVNQTVRDTLILRECLGIMHMRRPPVEEKITVKFTGDDYRRGSYLPASALGFASC